MNQSCINLSTLRFFNSFTSREVHHMIDLAAPCAFAAGSTIFSEADAGNGMYLLVGGEVDIRRSASGKALTLATLQAGEIFGESDVLSFEAGRRIAAAVAARPCQALLFTREVLESLCRDDPICGQKFYRLLGAICMSRLKKMNEMYTETIQIPVEAKAPALKSLLQQLSEQWGI